MPVVTQAYERVRVSASMKAEDLSKNQLLALAKEHVRHFRHLLEVGRLGDKTIIYVECRRYLNIWEGAVANGGEGPLTAEQHQEVQDAIDCGDYGNLIERAGRMNPPTRLTAVLLRRAAQAAELAGRFKLVQMLRLGAAALEDGWLSEEEGQRMLQVLRELEQEVIFDMGDLAK